MSKYDTKYRYTFMEICVEPYKTILFILMTQYTIFESY